MPARGLSSMLARINGELILFDCGEGTQVAIKKSGYGFKNIKAIAFTHYHADHISGLPGLLHAIRESGRTEDLYIFGPPRLTHIINCLRVIVPDLSYKIIYCEEIKKFDLFYNVELSALEVDHSETCYAYCLKLRRAGKFDPEKAKNVPMKAWSRLQKGENYEIDGKIYSPDTVLGPERKGVKLCFCTDSRPTKQMPDFFSQADLLILEGLYGDPALVKKAAARKHMVFTEAAKIAKAAAVKRLWLTHFSPSMPNPKEYIFYARDIFKNTRTGKDLMSITLDFEEDNA